jgi:hypothetical protein
MVLGWLWKIIRVTPTRTKYWHPYASKNR